MNLEIKQRWIEALRSGKYKQGTDALHTAKDNTFCCLGVLCDISGMGNWHVRDGLANYKIINEKGVVHVSKALPVDIVKWADLDGINPRVKGKDLVYFNDIEQLTFNEIADIIEENL